MTEEERAKGMDLMMALVGDGGGDKIVAELSPPALSPSRARSKDRDMMIRSYDYGNMYFAIESCFFYSTRMETEKYLS